MQPVSFTTVPNDYRVHPVHARRANAERNGNHGIDYQQQNKEHLAKAYQDAVAIANLKDEQLLSIAKVDANKNNKYSEKTYKTALLAVPVLDTVLNGAIAKSPKLSSKLGVMGKTAAGWAGAYALAGVYGGMVNKISAVSPVVRNFEEKHPVIKSLMTLAGFAGVLIGSDMAVKKLGEVLPKKFPEIAAGTSKLKAGIAKTVDKSFFNKKLVRPLKARAMAFAKHNPRLAGVTVATLALSVPFIAMGTLFKAITERAEKAAQVQDTYKQLAAVRNANRQVVDKINQQAVSESIANLANVMCEKELQEAKLDAETQIYNKDVVDDERETKFNVVG